MKKWILRIAAIGALAGLGVWGWGVLFPSPEKIIRSHLNELAKTISFESGEGNIGKMWHLKSLPDFFTVNVIVNTEVPGYPPHVFNGRDEIMQAAMAARSRLEGLKVEFLDVNVQLGPDKQTAMADLTGKATASGQNDFWAQEFRFSFKLVDGKWLIDRVETVKTLM